MLHCSSGLPGFWWQIWCWFCSPQMAMSLPPCWFQDSFFVFNSLSRAPRWISEFILLGARQTSWICRLMYCIRFRKLWAIVSLDDFSPLCLSLWTLVLTPGCLFTSPSGSTRFSPIFHLFAQARCFQLFYVQLHWVPCACSCLLLNPLAMLSFPLLHFSAPEFLFGSFFNGSYLFVDFLALCKQCLTDFLCFFMFSFSPLSILKTVVLESLSIRMSELAQGWFMSGNLFLWMGHVFLFLYKPRDFVVVEN